VAEDHEEAEKALNGELAELAAEHFGDVGLLDAEQSGGLRLFQATAFQDCMDLVDELRLDQVFFGIGDAEVFENVSASHFVSVLLHDSLSLTIPAASARRRRVNSMSRRGVSRPDFDFF